MFSLTGLPCGANFFFFLKKGQFPGPGGRPSSSGDSDLMAERGSGSARLMQALFTSIQKPKNFQNSSSYPIF